MKTKLLLTALAVVTVALLVSCGEDNVTGSKPKYSRSTPEALMQAFAYALEQRDIDIYGECLGDEYLFEFTAMDAELVGLPPAEPWWGKTEDVSVMSNMFGHEDVQEIECTLAIQNGPFVIEDGWGYRLEPDIGLTVSRPGEEPIIYLTNASWLDVEIIEDPYDTTAYVFKSMSEVWKGELEVSAARFLSGGSVGSFGNMKAMFMD
jgi:hypothetical protein